MKKIRIQQIQTPSGLRLIEVPEGHRARTFNEVRQEGEETWKNRIKEIEREAQIERNSRRLNNDG